MNGPTVRLIGTARRSGDASSFSTWAKEQERLEAILTEAGPPAVLARIEKLLSEHPSSTDAYLLAGRALLRMGKSDLALRMFTEAHRLALPGNLGFHHPDTGALITAQLRTEPPLRPCREKIERNLAGNLAVLDELDPPLGREIREAPDFPDAQVIEVWDRLYVASAKTGRVAVESEKNTQMIDELPADRSSIAFHGVGSGQEVLHLLHRAPRLFLGMTRILYLFEKDARLLRNFFRLTDLSAALREKQLVVFGGAGWAQSVQRAFSSHRLPIPSVIIGDRTPYLPECEDLKRHLEAEPGVKARVLEYHASEAFRDRLEEVAAGRRLPRVLFLACRWTTVLQHVCADFRRGFEELGSKCETVIEESNVEALGIGCYHEALERLKPDLVFSVSHARPSYGFVPRPLPVVCFYMDRCPPILDLKRLDGLVEPADMFFCIFDRFVAYLHEKGVSPGQLVRMATPADERVYRPLAPGSPLLARYASQVSWVKHGGPDPDRKLKEFLGGKIAATGEPFETEARRVLEAVHRKVHADRDRFFHDEEVQELAAAELSPSAPAEWKDRLRALTTSYKDLVYGLSYRQFLLEPLAASGIDLKLFGTGWNQHPTFFRFSGGPVARGEHLNAVYNASAINLNIHPMGGMHQRLAEGALAGGFFLVNRLMSESGFEDLSPWFTEGSEVVYFDSPRELLEKCRYYLDRPDERRQIAARMRARAVEQLTVKVAAGRVLESFRERLKVLGARKS